MRGFQGAARLLVTALRTPRVPRAGVTSKPPEHPLSAAVSTWGWRDPAAGRGRLGGTRTPLCHSQTVLLGVKQRGAGEGGGEAAAPPTLPLGLLLPADAISAPFFTSGVQGTCWGSPWPGCPRGLSSGRG